MESETNKRSPGRPSTGIGPAIGLRLYPDIEAKLDVWRAQQPDKPGRPEAIRRLLMRTLEGNHGLPNDSTETT